MTPSSKPPSLRRKMSQAQVRYLAVAWVALTIIVGICTFAALFWALGGGFGNNGGEVVAEEVPAEPTVESLTPTEPPAAEEPTPVPEEEELPEGEGTGGGGEGEPAAASPGTESGLGYGVQIQAINTGDPNYWMDLVTGGLGFDWIKHQFQWGVYGSAGPDQFDWSGYDPMMEAAASHNLKVMLSVIGAPPWSRALGGTDGPPDDYQIYADFLVTLIDRYPDQIKAIEVWNEQNLDRDWHAGDLTLAEPDAVEYVRLLRIANEAIKAKDPSIIVISGALSPTGGRTEDDGRVTAIDDIVYLQWMVNAGMLNYTDCVGVHHNGINVPPDMAFDAAPTSAEAPTWSFRGPADNPHHSWSMYSTITGYHDIVGDTPLCITEFGWPSREGLNEDLIVRQGFEFAVDNTQEEQTQYVTRAFEMFRELGYIRLAFLYNLNLYFINDLASSDNVYWALLDSNGAPRPVFGAVAEMPKP